VLDPKDVTPNLHKPKVWIQEIIADGVVHREPFLDGTVSKVVIPAGTRRMEIHYAGLSYIAPAQVLFKSRLDGLDTEWNEVGNRRVAYFQGLPPGDYQFHVIACNNDGLWTDTPTSIVLQVQPFFWQTRLFQFGIFVGAGLLLWGIIHRRLSQLQKEKRQQLEFSARLIESQELERKRLASEIHDGLGQNFLILKNRAEIALQASEPAEVSDQLREIADTAGVAVQEVRELAHKLRPYQLDRLGLTLALQAMVKQFSGSGLNLQGTIDPVDNIVPREHEIHLYRIVQESLNNISKHSKATEVTLEVRATGSELMIRIRDNGLGFDAEQMLNRPDSKRGLGLGGLLERARNIGGEVQIESEPGRGTTVQVTVPLNQQRNISSIPGLTASQPGPKRNS
jgi:signal transduction histidine kinase